MSLYETIQSDMYEAMKTKDKFKASTLRIALAKLKDKKIEKREDLNKNDEIKIIQNLVKQRKEAADIYEKNNRSELMENEMEELKILSLYLPKMMSGDELRALIESIISETGAKNMSDMGKVMPEIMKRSAGKADGKMVILFLDVLACFFIAIMGSIGFRRGFIEEIGRLIGLLVSTLFSLKYYLLLSAKILSIIQLNTFVVMVISFTTIFVLMLFIVRVLTRFFHILLTSRGIKFANRSMGFVFGALKGIIILMLFYWTIDLFPSNKWISIIRDESYLSYKFTNSRYVIINLFHLEDPVKEGEKFIKDMINNDQITKNEKS